jgi:V/A-type H+/Na+-transporting ATPase subunit I
MIVKLHKYLVYGAKDQISRFFELAQRAGFMEFIGASHKRSLELTDDAKTVLSAIKIAKKHEVHPEDALPLSLSPVELSAKLIDANSSLEKLLEEKRMLTSEIARIAPFGDFSMDALRSIEKEGRRVFQFFCMKSDLAREISLPSEIQYISTEYDLDYFVSINKERAHYHKMIEIQIDEPVGALYKRLSKINEKITQLERDIRNHSNYLPILQSGLLDLMNDYQLALTKHDVADYLEGKMFAIEAWVPETKIKSLFALIGSLKVSAEEIAVDSSDSIPTCMENKGIGKVGEDIVNIYDTPADTDKDPSTWVLVSFALFFAMIVGDAGYGLLYLLIGLFFKYKNPKMNAVRRRFIKLVLIVSTCTIVWGACTASFFGIDIGPNNPYRKFSLLNYLATEKAEYHLEQEDDVYVDYTSEFPAVEKATGGSEFLQLASEDKGDSIKYTARETFYDNILMEISLLVGIIHISLSFIRYMTRNWSGLGWIFFMWGGYLYFPKMLNATTLFNFLGVVSKPVAFALGEQMIFFGVGFAVLVAIIKQKWGAINELMNIVQIFGDVLSYIRLYALALAGMMVASTFNSLGVSAGLLGGIFIILFGHVTNICLSIMGGVIHGLRLNFLEWYHYSFDGSGRLFNPLRLKRTK